MRTLLLPPLFVRCALATSAVLWLAACDAVPPDATSPTPADEPTTDLVESATTIATTSATLGDALPGLTADQIAAFDAGKEEFEAVEEVDEGLGPVFNEAGCAVCHAGPVGGTTGRVETRFGRKGNGPFDPLAGLGGSLLNDHGIGLVPAGDFTFVGEVVPRRANVIAPRITTQLFGLGLVDAVPDEALIQLARREARNSPGTAGTPSKTTEIKTGQIRVGRFGWKAQVPTLHQFAGDAYLNEMGITNPEFPDESCPQGDCAALAHNPVPELNDTGDGVEKFADFMTLLAAPAPGPRSLQTRVGSAVFAAIGCADCHTPVLVTGDSPVAALSHKAFQPFSDFLLHDMGSLGDGIVQGSASARQMRTAPLWGIRTRSLFLHDASATTIHAAILAHDGQGRHARNSFANLSRRSREALLAFVNSL